MFTCRECLRRAFNSSSRAGIPKNLSASHSSLPPLSATTKASRPNKKYSTVATAQELTADETRSDVAHDPTRKDHGDNKPSVLGRSAKWAARKELEYLNDALHIANRVAAALNKDDFEVAAQITRQASKDKNVIVSWNHLIDYQLRNGRIHAAMKLYNEMKKRAHQPNAQTFTIIFRGCAKSEHPKLAVGEAVRLYQNMLSVGRLKPNTIHLNAVLQVCAKAEDLDSMFGILSSSNDALRSPNNLTYTTILNAMRKTAERPLASDDPARGLAETDIENNKRDTIQRAKSIWEEVVSRWRAGSLIIDEELVCAMGRILLMGDYTDADYIESLIEQTMMIPRVENKGLSKPQGTESSTMARNKQASKAPGAPAITHALPGNNSLSMILEALEKTRRSAKAVKYWNVFTREHNVVPDVDNWTCILKVYNVGKNSGRASVALNYMPGHMLTQKHVRLAMKACLRDNLNKLAFENATAVLRTMGEKLELPDIQTLRTYLQVAHASKRSFDIEAKDDHAGAMDSWARILYAALEHLSRPYQALVEGYFTKQKSVSDAKSLERLQNSQAEVVALARKMSAACGILTHEHTTSFTKAQLAKMELMFSDLTRFMNRYYEKRRGKPAGEQEVVKDKKPKQQDNSQHSKPRRLEDTDDRSVEHKSADSLISVRYT
ncbi:hypothetical protein F5B22DRAFT_159488 [Xylaria bambusicola]|uniref:uncharacterized protein n=1 Tax=Xylaria bambusicola TaxID=326684 RepID=UPI00200824FB|nr:uncharacterized protein F5B22DRAFT_159488 [Xylaria bambusicola]KAI0526472.1 hypothetical protein F5B22DRAFT_159488 [Xylaria bambusicola]